MIMYKYRLKDCTENEKYNSRSIQGFILNKDEWFASKNKLLKLQNYTSSLVEEITFDPIIEAQNNKKKLEENKTKEQKEKEKEDQKDYNERLKNLDLNLITIDDDTAKYNKLSKKELIDELIEIDPSFDPSNFKGRTKEEVLQTLVQVKVNLGIRGENL